MDDVLALIKLNCLISVYTGGAAVAPERDLMASPACLPPYNMAALFLDIEKEFSISLNELVPKLDVFSPNRILQELMGLISVQDAKRT